MHVAVSVFGGTALHWLRLLAVLSSRIALLMYVRGNLFLFGSSNSVLTGQRITSDK